MCSFLSGEDGVGGPLYHDHMWEHQLGQDVVDFLLSLLYFLAGVPAKQTSILDYLKVICNVQRALCMRCICLRAERT